MCRANRPKFFAAKRQARHPDPDYWGMKFVISPVPCAILQQGAAKSDHEFIQKGQVLRREWRQPLWEIAKRHCYKLSVPENHPDEVFRGVMVKVDGELLAF
jgi:hypothetical protein